MNDLWQKSQDTGKEQAGFIYPDGHGGYAFNKLADYLIEKQTRFHIYFHIPSNIPAGAIYVHTHPKRTIAQAFGYNYENYHHASNGDYTVMSQLEQKGVQKGFILDEGKINIYNSEEIIDKIDRCGY